MPTKKQRRRRQTPDCIKTGEREEAARSDEIVERDQPHASVAIEQGAGDRTHGNTGRDREEHGDAGQRWRVEPL